MSYVLRPYQQEAADVAVQFLKDPKIKHNAIEILPTGSGKSLVISDVARQLDDHVLVLQPGKEILEQNLQKYLSYGNFASVFSASLNQKQISKVTFATIGSVNNKMEAFKHFKYLIVDECHYVNPQKGMYKKLNDYLGVKVLGLTATPYRLNTDGFGGSMLKFITRTRPRVFRDVIYWVQIADLCAERYLAPVQYIDNDDFDSRCIRLNSTGADFDEESMRAYMQDMHIFDKAAVAVINNLHRQGIICFAPFIEDAQYIRAHARQTEIVTSNTPKKAREELIKRFRSGDIKCIVNVGILTTGFDYPELDTIILARPTMSMALYYQMIGRGIRPHPTKEFCRVIDLTDNYKRFGKIEDFVFYPNDGKPYIGSGERQLTNVYFQDQDKALWEDVVMPFGKYKGEKVSGIDITYIKWLQENVDMYSPLKEAVLARLR